MVQIILSGLWLGLVFNAAPGAVFTESLRRGIRDGFRPALAVQIGSLAGDAVWAVLGLVGAAALLTQDALRIPVTLIGCVVLAVLGVQGLIAAIRPPAPLPDLDTKPRSAMRGALAAGALMSLSNVWNVVYWAGAGGAIGSTLNPDQVTLSMIVFFLAFMTSSVAWCFIVAGFIAGLKRMVNPLWTRVIEAVSGVALIVMAIILAVQATTG